MAIFLDTGFYFALLAKRDPHHNRAEILFPQVAAWEFGRPMTSDYILDEAMTLISTRVKGEKSVLLKKMQDLFLGEEPIGYLVRIDSDGLPEIANLHQKLTTSDPAPSFTDCSNIIACQKY